MMSHNQVWALFLVLPNKILYPLGILLILIPINRMVPLLIQR